MHDTLLTLHFTPMSLGAIQGTPWDDPPTDPTPPPPPKHPISFSDLQQSLHDYNTGKGDNGFRNGILIILVLIALFALVLHFRQRHKNAGPPDSIHKLGRELGKPVRFPVASRVVLKWVARSTQTPFAALMLSAALFDKCVNDWSNQPTFSVARHWGRTRLERLRPVLFD